MPAFILEPAMAAAINVQEHARQRTPGSSFAMHPAFPSPLYQPGSLQSQLHPGVAELNLVLLAQLLVKMTHVQIEILLAIQSEYLLHLCQWNSFRRRGSSSAIEQPVIAKLLVALPPTTHVPVADADDLRRLPPGYPFCHRT